MAITIDSSKVVKQIKDSNNVLYTIDAPLWEGHRFSDVQSMIHGVVDTYVIPAQSNAADGSDYKKVVETLGGLPSQKLHCSVLAEEAIKKAIEDYLSKKKA